MDLKKLCNSCYVNITLALKGGGRSKNESQDSRGGRKNLHLAFKTPVLFPVIIK